MSALMLGIVIGVIWNAFDAQREKVRLLQLRLEEPEKVIVIDGVEYTKDDLGL